MHLEKKEKGSSSLLPAAREKRNFWKELSHACISRTRGELITDFLVLVCAFLLARTHALFGIYPFALSLLCALNRHVPAALIGAAAGALAMPVASTLYLAIYIGVFLLRLVFSYAVPRFFESRGLFDEHPLFRVLEACLAGCSMAAYELALFGIYDYTVLFALGAVFIPPLLTLLYAALTETGITLPALVGKEPFFAENPSRTGAVALFLQLGGLALGFSVVLSLRPYAIFGLSISRSVLAFFTLFVSRRFGGVRGACAGLVMALAEDAVYIPTYGLLGLLSGLYGTVGMPCALAAAVAAGGGYAVYAGGLTGFLSVVPELSVSALLAWPILYRLSPVDADFFSAHKRPLALPYAKLQDTDGVARAYREIAALLSASAESEREGSEAFSVLCQRIKGSTCRRCAEGGACGESEAVLAALETGNGEGVMCEHFAKMRSALARERAEAPEKKRFGGEKGAFSAEYALHARFLEEREGRRTEASSEDESASERLCEFLSQNGYSFESVCVLGKRCRRVLLGGTKQKLNPKERERVCALTSLSLGESFPTVRVTSEGRKFLYVLESEQRYTLKTATLSRAKQKEEPSGDRAARFDTENGVAFAALSDGMGSGRAAADAAALCVGALSSLLTAGAKEATALSLVGNLLCAGGEERSVALDLLSVDLYSGRICFYKSGAAASFMLRDGSLYRIRAKTIPMGVLRGVDAEKIELRAEEGDLLVLLSDGVLGGREDGGWLKTLLLGERTDDLSALAEKILSEAERENGVCDDRTVFLAKLCPVDAHALVSA